VCVCVCVCACVCVRERNRENEREREYVCVRVCVYSCVCVCVCLCVCVYVCHMCLCVREREKERETDRQTEFVCHVCLCVKCVSCGCMRDRLIADTHTHTYSHTRTFSGDMSACICLFCSFDRSLLSGPFMLLLRWIGGWARMSARSIADMSSTVYLAVCRASASTFFHSGSQTQ